MDDPDETRGPGLLPYLVVIPGVVVLAWLGVFVYLILDLVGLP